MEARNCEEEDTGAVAVGQAEAREKEEFKIVELENSA